MSKITASTDFARLKPEEMQKFVAILAEQLVTALNGQLDFSTNFNCKLHSISFSAADTDTALAHGLGREPTGYLVYGLSASMVVYSGSAPSTTNLLYLRSSAIGSASMIVF